MGNALVAVPASDEEHGCTIGNCSNNSSSCYSCAGGVDFAAGAGVASNSTSIASTSSRSGGGVPRSDVRASTRKRTASCKRASGVDQVGKVVDGSILVMIKQRRRVAQISCKLVLQIFGDGEHGHGGNETLVSGRVQRLQAPVVDIGDVDFQTICNSLGQITEDLVGTIVGSHEWIVQGPLEANLAHEAVLRDLRGNTIRRSNHPWQTRRNATAGSGSR